MNLFKRLWEWLTSASSAPLRKAHPDLRPIDTGKLVRELDLVEQAKRLGTAGLPAPDAVTLSGPESAIVQRVEKARQDYVDWAVTRLSVVNENIAREDTARAINRARQADQEFVRKASALFSEHEALLRSLSRLSLARADELAAFRKENLLARDPHYPTPTGTALRYAILILLVVFEGLLNAGFFAQGLSTGLIGGAAYAMGLAGVNVCIAFAFGLKLVRYTAHRNPAYATLGWLCSAVAMAVMCTIGLGISHFRDALTAESADAAATALQTLIASPFQLRDLMSWGLFGISLCFGFIALFDGLSMDDRYPGYGAIARRAHEANQDLDEELNALREALNNLRDEELQMLDQTVEKARVSLLSMASAISDKVAANSRLHTAFRDADNALASLIQKFRDENQLHRGAVPRPAYFDQAVTPRRLSVPDLSSEVDERALKDQEKELDKLITQVDVIRAGIQAAYNQQFDRLKPLDSQFAR